MTSHKQTDTRLKMRLKQDRAGASALTPPCEESRSHAAAAVQRSRFLSRALTSADIVRLQRTLGNRQVGRLLRERRPAQPQAPTSPSGAQPGPLPVIQRQMIDHKDNYRLHYLAQEQKRRKKGGRTRPKGDKYERLTPEELDMLIMYHSHNRSVFQPRAAQQPPQQQFQNNVGQQQNLASMVPAPFIPSFQQSNNNNIPFPTPSFGAQQQFLPQQTAPLFNVPQQNQQLLSEQSMDLDNPAPNFQQTQQVISQSSQSSQHGTTTTPNHEQQPLFQIPRPPTAEEMGWQPWMEPTEQQIAEYNHWEYEQRAREEWDNQQIEEMEEVEGRINKGNTLKLIPHLPINDPIEFIKQKLNSQQGMDKRLAEGYKRLSGQFEKAKKEGNPSAFTGFYHQLAVTNHYEQKNKVLGVEENQHGPGAYRGNQGEYVSADIVVTTNKPQSQLHPEKIVEVKYRPSSSYGEKYALSTLKELKVQLESDLRETGKVKLWWYGAMPEVIKEYVIDLVCRYKGFSFQTFDLQ